MKKIVAVFLAVCMIELLTLPAYALDLENNKYILASEYKSADLEVQKRIEQDCNSFSQMGLDKEWVRIVKIDGVDDREILYAVCSMDNTAYVPYKIGKLQIQGFSEPTTPNKIKQSYHITQKAARSRPRAAFLRGKLGRRQDFSKK